MKVLVLGAGGMLARDVIAAAPDGVEVVALDRAACDVTDAAMVERVVAGARADWILNGAAWTAVDAAESAREPAMQLNGEAPGHIGRAAAAHGARVLQPSTDYVFPGTGTTPWRETDPTAPLNWYGETKLVGERALAESGAEHLIVRVQWLYGATGRSFPRTMRARARAGQPTRVVDDQRGTPTYTVDLAGGLWRLIAADARGIVHLANAGSTTWFDVAARIFAHVGVPSLVTRCPSTDYPTPAERPANGVLDQGRAASLGVTLPPWEDALDRWLAADGTSPIG